MGGAGQAGADAGPDGCAGMLCGGVCTDTQQDDKNCGKCGNACPTGIACQNGACACPNNGKACGGTCVDTQSDKNNCGGCNVICPGSCTDGRCLVQLAGGSPRDLAVDSKNVYWTEANGFVDGIPIGGGQVNALAKNLQSPGGIAIDASKVYWTDYTGTVNQVTKVGGALPLIASGQGTPRAVAVDGSVIYWANATTATSIVKFAGGTTTVLATNQNSPADIAADANDVYWVNSGDGTVMKVPVGGGAAPSKLATGGGSEQRLLGDTRSFRHGHEGTAQWWERRPARGRAGQSNENRRHCNQHLLDDRQRHHEAHA